MTDQFYYLKIKCPNCLKWDGFPFKKGEPSINKTLVCAYCENSFELDPLKVLMQEHQF